MDPIDQERYGGVERPTRSRKVSAALFAGVLLMPAIFVWFLMRRGYSTRSQIIGVVWLGVIGVILLLQAPHALVKRPPPRATQETSPRLWEATAPLAQVGQPALDFKLERTHAVHRMLRTPVTLKNNVGRDLQYVEVFCSYYDGRGGLLGHGMSNWGAVKAGDTVAGEVVASGVTLDDVQRRECRARHL